MAIAYVNSSSAKTASSTNSLTYSYTVTTETLLVVGTQSEGSGATDPTGITYNGVAMTKIASNTDVANRNSSIWELANPSGGANNVVISTSTNAYTTSGTIGLTGTSGTTGITGKNNGSGTTASVSVTTQSDNSWLIDSLYLNDDSGTATAGGSQTQRYGVTGTGDGTAGYGSTQATTTAGSYTMTWSLSVSQSWNMCTAEIKVDTPANGNFLIFM